MSVAKKQNAAPAKVAPKRRNKKSKREKTENFVPAAAKRDTYPVNPSNDSEMIREGLRVPPFEQDPEWHKKTEEERKKLSVIPKIKGLRASKTPIKEDPIKRRLTVYLKNPTKSPNLKTTYSEKIESYKLYGYLNMTFGKIKDQINKIYYNGKKLDW